MKRINLLFTLGLVLLLCGCSTYYPSVQESEQEEIAYLLFVSPTKHKGEAVTVTMDGKTTFRAKVLKAKKPNRRGRKYAATTGRRHISVQQGRKVLYEKEIMLSAQETHIITLP